MLLVSYWYPIGIKEALQDNAEDVCNYHLVGQFRELSNIEGLFGFIGLEEPFGDGLRFCGFKCRVWHRRIVGILFSRVPDECNELI